MERPLNRKEINTYLNSLYAQMYIEKPVSVEQFIKDESYLGKVTSKGNAIYPIWIDALNTIFTDDSKIQVVLTGAIGTGKTATPQQAQEVHSMIRSLLGEIVDVQLADDIRILYGGSVKPDNTADLMAQEDVDGLLVGGASLKSDDFIAIIQAAA